MPIDPLSPHVFPADTSRPNVSATASPKNASAIAGALAGKDTISIAGSQASTLDGAARDAIRRANPQSVTDNLEYGGLLYQNRNGSFGATQPVRGTATGFDPGSVSIPNGTRLAGDYHTHADYSRADSGGAAIRTGSKTHDDFHSDAFSSTDHRGIAADAHGNSGYAGYLGTPSGTHLKFDPASGATTNLRVAERAGASGGAVGALAGAALSTAGALTSGHADKHTAAAVAEGAALGGTAGAAASVLERHATNAIDRVAGPAITSSLARTAFSRIGGASIAGAAASIGISAFENRAGIARGDSKAIGNVAGDAVVGTSSALAGAATGALVGSVVPVAGTIVGAGVGLVAGYAADRIMRSAGVDSFVSRQVGDGVDSIKRGHHL